MKAIDILSSSFGLQAESLPKELLLLTANKAYPYEKVFERLVKIKKWRHGDKAFKLALTVDCRFKLTDGMIIKILS